MGLRAAHSDWKVALTLHIPHTLRGSLVCAPSCAQGQSSGSQVRGSLARPELLEAVYAAPGSSALQRSKVRGARIVRCQCYCLQVCAHHPPSYLCF